jgi:hypothetical protein
VYAQSSSFLEAVELLLTLQVDSPSGAGEPLVLDTHSCELWRYYFTIHPNHGELARKLNARFVVKCPKSSVRAYLLAAEMARRYRQRVWVLLTSSHIYEARRKRARYKRGLRVITTPILDEALILRLDPQRQRRRR